MRFSIVGSVVALACVTVAANSDATQRNMFVKLAAARHLGNGENSANFSWMTIPPPSSMECGLAISNAGACVASNPNTDWNSAMTCCGNMGEIFNQCGGSGSVLDSVAKVTQSLLDVNYTHNLEANQILGALWDQLGSCPSARSSDADCDAINDAVVARCAVSDPTTGATYGTNSGECCPAIRDATPTCLGTSTFKNDGDDFLNGLMATAYSNGCQPFPEDLCRSATFRAARCVVGAASNAASTFGYSDICCKDLERWAMFCFNYDSNFTESLLPWTVIEMMKSAESTCQNNDQGSGSGYSNGPDCYLDALTPYYRGRNGTIVTTEWKKAEMVEAADGNWTASIAFFSDNQTFYFADPTQLPTTADGSRLVEAKPDCGMYNGGSGVPTTPL